jgi:hypothetical protein
MRWNIPLLLASIAVAASSVQAAKPLVPIPLAPVGPWEVNYDDDSCHLIGIFGSGDDRIIVRFTRYQPGDEFSLALIGKPMRSRSPSSLVKLDFGPLVDPQEYRSFDGTMGKLPAAVFGGLTLIDKPKSAKSTTLADLRAALQTPGITPEQEALVGDLIIHAGNRKSYRLALGSMAAPMRTLRGCTTNLVKHWGLDPAEQASLTNKPTPIDEPGSWLRSNDYPAEMLRQLMGGLVQFRLDVSDAGLITGCHIQFRTNPDAFADLSCKLISKRGRFNPALDRNGKPIKSYFVSTVRWTVGS